MARARTRKRTRAALIIKEEVQAGKDGPKRKKTGAQAGAKDQAKKAGQKQDAPGSTRTDNMFADGRDDAQSAVMVISDGKWTNAYRTTMKATAMKDKGVQIFMAPIAENMDKKLTVLRGWASDPWETNFERIPGLDALLNNEPEYAQKLLVKFCPRAFSPSQKKEEEQQQGYLLIHEEGYPSDSCGEWKNMGSTDTAEACMELVKDAGILAFAFEEPSRGSNICYSEAIDVTDELWSDALNDRVNLTCPGGAWVYNAYASTYIMNPSMFGDIFSELS